MAAHKKKLKPTKVRTKSSFTGSPEKRGDGRVREKNNTEPRRQTRKLALKCRGPWKSKIPNYGCKIENESWKTASRPDESFTKTEATRVVYPRLFRPYPSRPSPGRFILSPSIFIIFRGLLEKLWNVTDYLTSRIMKYAAIIYISTGERI